MDTKPPESLYDLPPSAKLVFKVLEAEGQLTQQELTSHTLLSPRTVRYGLNALQEIGIIRTDVNLRDARQQLYSLDIERRKATSLAQ